MTILQVSVLIENDLPVILDASMQCGAYKKMYLILWLLGFQSILYHFLFVFCLLGIFVAYKVYQACKSNSLESQSRSMLVSASKQVMPNPKIQATNVARFATIVVLLVATSNQIESLEQVSK